jgi:hypothetical protein
MRSTVVFWRARFVNGSIGGVLEESFCIDGTIGDGGLVTVFELKSDPWLILPAPMSFRGFPGWVALVFPRFFPGIRRAARP